MARLERDGVGLAYEEAGDGGRALVFIHGIACDRSFMAPQLEHFSPQHRVVAVDLRGHGESDAPEGDYATELLASDVAWLCRELGLERPVLVGHSLGGVVALAAAAASPDLPSALVALDSPLIPSRDRDALMKEHFAMLERPDRYGDELRRYFARFFLDTDDPERKAWILDRVAQAPHHVVVSAWERGVDFDTLAAAQSVRVPLLYVDAGTPNTRLDELARLCPRLLVGRTVGSGHFHQLEVPGQVNAMIERFLAIAV